jgi:heptose I phosphotransferase
LRNPQNAELALVVERNCKNARGIAKRKMKSIAPIQSGDTKECDSTMLPGGGRIFIQREWKPVFERAGLSGLKDFFSLKGNTLSKPGLGKRYRAQLELARDGMTHSVFLKRYQGETLRNLFQRWSEDGERSAIAFREVRVALALEKLGIKTFRPLAWGWQGAWGRNQKSFLVMSQVPGDSLEHRLSQRTFSSTTEDWRRKKQLVEELARFAKRIHENGWFHRDFYLCHIFVSEIDGEFQLALVDLARMFRPRWRVQRWQIKDLAQLDFSAPTEIFSRTLRLRFLRNYFGVNRLTSAQKTLIRKISRKSWKIRQRELMRERPETNAAHK